MKKLLFLVSVSILFFSSCIPNPTEDPDPPTPPATLLVKKIITTNPGGTTDTENLAYSGNKITGITSPNGDYTTFTYTGDLITKRQEYMANGTLTNEETFEYNATNDLSIYKSVYPTDGTAEKVLYTHNADGTISYELYTGDETSQTTFDHNGKIYQDKTEENVAAMDPIPAHVDTHTFIFDDKSDPYNNITGYNKISFAGTEQPLGTEHNVIKVTHSNTIGLAEDISASAYTYNSFSYPLLVTETSASDGSITTYHYFY